MLVHTGSRGSDVLRVQRELLAAGISPGPLDGHFGPLTLKAVVAYQRKHHLAVDGVVGAHTWHALLTDGFTPGHAPKPPVAAPPKPVTGSSHGAKVNKMLDQARHWLGFHEGSGNANPFSRYFHRPGEAWCADFVSYCATKAGLHLNTCRAQDVCNILSSRHTWKGVHNPKPGDAITFRWDGSHGRADHVGIVEKVYKKNGHWYVQTIEGNSSDQVRRKTYPYNSMVINGYGTIT